MSLGDELWRQFGGDVPATAEQVARDAIQRYGSGRAAARALGVDEAQIRRWRDGKVKHSPNVHRIAQEARRTAAEGREGQPVAIRFRHAARSRTATFRPSQLVPGTEARVRDAYVRGDRDGMKDAFLAGVRDPWYRRNFREWDRAAQPAPNDDDSDSPGVFGA